MILVDHVLSHDLTVDIRPVSSYAPRPDFNLDPHTPVYRVEWTYEAGCSIGVGGAGCADSAMDLPVACYL